MAFHPECFAAAAKKNGAALETTIVKQFQPSSINFIQIPTNFIQIPNR
jgi:hypothetical protein